MVSTSSSHIQSALHVHHKVQGRATHRGRRPSRLAARRGVTSDLSESPARRNCGRDGAVGVVHEIPTGSGRVKSSTPAEILMVDAITQFGMVVDVCFLQPATSVTAGTIFHRRRHPCGCWSLPSAPSTQPRHDDRWRVRSPMPTTRRPSWSSGKRTYTFGARDRISGWRRLRKRATGRRGPQRI